MDTRELKARQIVATGKITGGNGCYHVPSQYGWEIDHIIPQSAGGSDNLANLRPLQWQNNAAKSDGRLTCAVTAAGVNNRAV